MPHPSIQARDEGMRRVSKLTRWVLAGSTALTGVFTAVAAVTIPGHAKASASTSRADSSSKETSTTSPSSTDRSGSRAATSPTSNTSTTLQAPSTPVTSSNTLPQIVSGGS